MTESQAWRKVAERIDRSEVFFGLCTEIGWLHHDARLISDSMTRVMARRVFSHCEPLDCYAYPPGTEREARVLAALWLALEAEEENA